MSNRIIRRIASVSQHCGHFLLLVVVMNMNAPCAFAQSEMTGWAISATDSFSGQIDASSGATSSISSPPQYYYNWSLDVRDAGRIFSWSDAPRVINSVNGVLNIKAAWAKGLNAQVSMGGETWELRIEPLGSYQNNIIQGFYPTVTTISPPGGVQISAPSVSTGLRLGFYKLNFSTGTCQPAVKRAEVRAFSVRPSVSGSVGQIRNLAVVGELACQTDPSRTVTFNLNVNSPSETESPLLLNGATITSGSYLSPFRPQNLLTGADMWVSAMSRQTELLTVTLPSDSRISRASIDFGSGYYVPRFLSLALQKNGIVNFSKTIESRLPAGSRPSVMSVDFEALNAVSGTKLHIGLSSPSSSFFLIKKIQLFTKPKYSAWQNQDIPCDVSGDGYVSPIDTLLVNYALNSGYPRVGTLPELHHFQDSLVDVNGDGSLTAIDLATVRACNP